MVRAHEGGVALDDDGVVGHGLLELREALVCSRAVVVGGNAVGPPQQGLVEVGDGPVGPARLDIGDASSRVRFRQLFFDPQRLGVVGDGLLVSSEAEVSLGPTEVRVGILRFQPEGVVEVPYRPLIVAVLQVDRPEAVECVAVRGIDADRVEIVQQREIERSGAFEGEAAVVVEVGDERVQQNGIGEVFHGLVVVPKVHVRHAAIAVRLDEVLIDIEYLGVLGDGAFELALVLERQRAPVEFLRAVFIAVLVYPVSAGGKEDEDERGGSGNDGDF